MRTFSKTALSILVLGLSAAPAMAQTSAAERANARERSSIDYRKANCPSGDRAACDRANDRARRSIDYRNDHATRYQRDPNAAVDRANRRDRDSIAYRSANCPSGDKAACARANEKARRAIEYRNKTRNRN